MAAAENQGRELLATAGVTVGGGESYDLQVNDDRFWARVLKDRELGLGDDEGEADVADVGGGGRQGG